MSSDEYQVECCEHGKVQATFVCRHLVGGENSDWYSDHPDKEDPYPDSWCGDCHRHFDIEGEWTDSAEEAVGGSESIKILCCHCYEKLKNKCTVYHLD